jgi:hypothetical protein
MSSSVQKEMMHSFYRILLPLVRLLLRTGIGFKEFAKLSKLAYVQAATEDYGIRGRPTNISRVAVMTGLTRKEVKSIREKGRADSEECEENWWESNFPPSDILHFWHTDPGFVDDAGNPRALPFSGESPSFTDLTRRYAGDIPPGAMRVELKRAGAIGEGEDGLLVPLMRYCVPFDLDSNFVQTIGYSMSRLANTVLKNSQQFEIPPEKRDSNFEKYVWTQNLSDEDKAEFKQLAEKKAMALLVELDDWIGVREQRANVGSEVKNRGISQRSVTGDCGLGVFYFGDD